MRRITCEDLALGFACRKILEAQTDDEIAELALAHVREDHGDDRLDEEQIRVAIAGSLRAAGGAG